VSLPSAGAMYWRGCGEYARCFGWRELPGVRPREALSQRRKASSHRAQTYGCGVLFSQEELPAHAKNSSLEKISQQCNPPISGLVRAFQGYSTNATDSFLLLIPCFPPFRAPCNTGSRSPQPFLCLSIVMTPSLVRGR
jgi:hypothetical protein